MTIAEKRNAAIEAARAIMTTAEAAGVVLTEEETRSFDQYMTEADGYKAMLERSGRVEEEARTLEQSRGRIATIAPPVNDELRSWLLREDGPKVFTANLRPDALRNMSDRNAWEARALSVATATAGGNTVPEGFASSLEVALLNHDGMRSVASVIRTASGNPLPWPTTDDTDNEGVLIGENTAATENDITFGSKTFGAYKFSSGIVRVSHELLQDSGVNVAQVVGELLGTRIGRVLNRYHTVGTGSAQPEGAATASTLGVTQATLAAVTFAELVQIQHSIDPSYRANAVWVINDATLAAIKSLVDGNGRPLWIDGMAGGAPATILGHRYVINQHMAGLGTAGARSILFGDLSKFKVRDVADLVIVRADERFFEFGQSAFLGWYRGDSKLLDAGTNPVKHFKNAAA